MPKSKIGVHINAVTDKQAMLRFFQRAQPVVALIIDHYAAADFVREAKKVSPYTTWVGRIHVAVQDQLVDYPLQRAREHSEKIMNSSIRDLMDVWVGYNELAGYPYLLNPGSEKVLAYLQFDIELATILNRRDKKYGCGSWSEGNPDIQWLYHPKFREACVKSAFLISHEYNAPTIFYPAAFDPPYVDPEVYIKSGWHTLRYRKIMEALGAWCPRIIITECGIDSLAANTWAVRTPNPSKHYGWRQFCAKPQDYLEQLQWYDRQIKKDQIILGACVYCYGTQDSTWDSFDIKGDMAIVLADYIFSTHDNLSQAEVEDLIGEDAQKHIIPYHTGAYYDIYRKQKGGELKGWEARSREVDFYIKQGYTFRYQVYVSGETQHIVYCRVSDDGKPLTLAGKESTWQEATTHFDKSN